jgi:hypothetical protein
MRYSVMLCAASALCSVGLPTQAIAATSPFTGSVTGVGFGSPDASCAPAPARGILNPSTSAGTSNLGSFTYGHNWCFFGANGPINGTFGINFGADSLNGTVTGLATPTGIFGLTNLDLSYSILGGTGIYSGASGTFGGLAISDISAGNGSQFSLNFTGLISSVPEPSSWALMLLGFGGMGLALRRAPRGRPIPAMA